MASSTTRPGQTVYIQVERATEVQGGVHHMIEQVSRVRAVQWTAVRGVLAMHQPVDKPFVQAHLLLEERT